MTTREQIIAEAKKAGIGWALGLGGMDEFLFTFYAIAFEAGRVAELKADIEEEGAIRERLTKLLEETAIALKGEEKALTKHSWHDLGWCAAQVVYDRDKLRKQVTLLREGFEKIKCLYLTSKVPFYVATIADEALAATADLKDVRLCEKEPAAWQTFDGEGGYDYRSYEDNEDYRDDYIKRNSSQKFYENWVIPLYRAWEPKP